MNRLRSSALCLFTILLVLLWSSERSVTAQEAAPPANDAAQIDTARAEDGQLVNELLSLLSDAVITRFEARLSLEGFAVNKGTVDLRGVHLQNFNLGLRLKPRAARKLLGLAQKHLARDEQTASYFEVLRLAVFNDIEFGIHLDELSVAALQVRAEDLQVEGLLLYAGATPPADAAGGSGRNSIEKILRRAILHQVQVHAGLKKLAASALKVNVQQFSLRGLQVGLALRRNSE